MWVNCDSSSYADSSKTRTQAMYKTRTLPIGESGEARGGDAKRDGRKTEKGERRGPDEDLQGPANYKRVRFINNFFICNLQRVKEIY